MSTPSARLRSVRTTDTVSGRRDRAVVIAQAVFAIFGKPAICAINPREMPQVASTNKSLFILVAFIVKPFDKKLSYFPSNLNLFSTENTPLTPFARMCAMSISPCDATTPTSVTFPFSTMIWIGGTACSA